MCIVSQVFHFVIATVIFVVFGALDISASKHSPVRARRTRGNEIMMAAMAVNTNNLLAIVEDVISNREADHPILILVRLGCAVP